MPQKTEYHSKKTFVLSWYTNSVMKIMPFQRNWWTYKNSRVTNNCSSPFQPPTMPQRQFLPSFLDSHSSAFHVGRPFCLGRSRYRACWLKTMVSITTIASRAAAVEFPWGCSCVVYKTLSALVHSIHGHVQICGSAVCRRAVISLRLLCACKTT